MATQFLGVMRSSELGSARGVKREGGESSRLDRPRVARLSGKHSLPRIDLRRRAAAVYSKFTRAEPIPPFIVGEPRIMVWPSRDDETCPLLLFSGDDDGTFLDHVGKQVQRKGLRHLVFWL